MGVRRMQTFMEQFCPEACYEVSIAEIANEHRLKYKEEPIIVVDGSCCFRKLYGNLDWVCGGQYKEYADTVTAFINGFEDLGIKLVLFFDGATQEEKRPVWVNRRLQSMKKAHAVIDLLKAAHDVQSIDKENFVLPAGSGNVMSSISRTRCVVQRSLLECDEEISYFAERNRCLAILAQDSDYVIYQNGAQYYLSSDHLNISTMKTVAYDKAALARHLNLDLSDLPLLATLMGNDVISADDLKLFHKQVVGRGYHKKYTAVLVRSLAEYIKSLPRGKDIFAYLNKLSRDVFHTPHRAEHLRQSILGYGKDFVNPAREVDHRCQKWDQIMYVAYSNYVNMVSPSFIYNILRKLPFEMSTALEDCRTNVPPSAVVLREMRKRIYGIALREYPGHPNEKFIVEEWCMSGPESLKAALKVTAILPPDRCPDLLNLWLNDSNDMKEDKFRMLAWVGSVHLLSAKLIEFAHEIIAATCILSYLYHDVGILDDWEVKVFATVVVDVQAMKPEELAGIIVRRVHVRGVQLATLFTRAITHFVLANSICGNPVLDKWTRHPQLFDGKLFQSLYLNGKFTPKHGNLQHYNQICQAVLS